MEPNQSLEYWKAYGPPIAALVVVFISNLALLLKIRLDSKAAIKKELSLSFINLTKERLTNFYDPLVVLLKINRDIFDSLGPKSFSEDHNLRNEAAEVWRQLINDVILPTNKRICEVILQYSHLIDETDDLEIYTQFIKHAKSYEVFRNTPNEIHKKFPYPPGFLEKVSVIRSSVKGQLDNLELETGMYLKETNHGGLLAKRDSSN